MFEDSIFESTGAIRTGSRNWMLATFALNGSVLLALVLLPLVYPEALPERLANILLTAPPPPTSPPPQIARAAEPLRGAPPMDARQFVAPRIIPNTIRMVDRTGSTSGDRLIVMNEGPGTGIPGGLPGTAARPAVAPAPHPHGPVHISSGVAQGMILNKVMPQYPAIAKEMRVSGTVELQAVISKTGAIENLRVLRGPAMLQQASIDAVRQWRYRPFLLNGEPVAVETTISVVFTLGG